MVKRKINEIELGANLGRIIKKISEESLMLSLLSLRQSVTPFVSYITLVIRFVVSY